MLRALAAWLVFFALPAGAGSEEFIDDRSSPERVLVSVYNAINRQEYLRAWSYFGDGAAPPFEEFRDGYRDTAAVELRVGAIASEGAAGSIHSQVPVALRATATGGTVAVYAGCYRLTQVQPALQEVLPFRPIVIDDGARSGPQPNLSRRPWEPAVELGSQTIPKSPRCTIRLRKMSPQE